MSTVQLSVVYEGLVLSKAAEAKATDAGLFVALAAPMPVGTRLAVEHAGDHGVTRHTLKVAKTVETGESGVVLVDENGGRATLDMLFPATPSIAAPEPIHPEVTLRDAAPPATAHAETPAPPSAVHSAATIAAAEGAGISADLISRLSPSTGVPIVELTAEPSASHASPTPPVATPAAVAAAPTTSPASASDAEAEESDRAEGDRVGESKPESGDGSDKNGTARKGRKNKRSGPRR